MFSPPNAIYFEASHWPSGHMVRSSPHIGQHPPPLQFYFIILTLLAYLIAISAFICIGQESWCLLCGIAGFSKHFTISHESTRSYVLFRKCNCCLCLTLYVPLPCCVVWCSRATRIQTFSTDLEKNKPYELCKVQF